VSKINYAIPPKKSLNGHLSQIHNSAVSAQIDKKAKTMLQPLAYMIGLARRIFRIKNAYTISYSDLKQYCHSEHLPEALEIIEAKERAGNKPPFRQI